MLLCGAAAAVTGSIEQRRLSINPAARPVDGSAQCSSACRSKHRELATAVSSHGAAFGHLGKLSWRSRSANAMLSGYRHFSL